jgi:hypothetical protein
MRFCQNKSKNHTGKGALEGDCALDGFGDAAERSHKAIAHGLDLGATVRLQHLAGDPLVLAEDVAATLVAESRHHFGVTDEVGEKGGAEGGRPTASNFTGRAAGDVSNELGDSPEGGLH